METIKFRAKTKDNKTVVGFYYYNQRVNQHIIHCNNEIGKNESFNIFGGNMIKVIGNIFDSPEL